jgi:paraquat-inducible protein B
MRRRRKNTMSENTGALPKAIIEKTRLTWVLWLVPIAAAGLCGWFIFRDVVLQGPAITIYFQNIEGLQEQNSFLQYRGAQVGHVTGLKLAADKQLVAVHVRLSGPGADLARQGSVFWIVRPELKLGSVSGLRTIVTGDYIAVQPGEGAPTNAFVGVEQPPLEHQGALEITLLSPQLGSLQEQSPIFYRGIQVGEVLQCRLGGDAREVIINAFIRSNYTPLVRMDSKFWNAGGLSVHIGLFSGVKISAESAQTIISGGIEFATPPDFQDAATNGTVFALNEKADDAWGKWAPAIALPAQPPALPESRPATNGNLLDIKPKQ